MGKGRKDKQREGAGVKSGNKEEETDRFSWERERRQREAGTEQKRDVLLAWVARDIFISCALCLGGHKGTTQLPQLPWQMD